MSEEKLDGAPLINLLQQAKSVETACEFHLPDARGLVMAVEAMAEILSQETIPHCDQVKLQRYALSMVRPSRRIKSLFKEFSTDLRNYRMKYEENISKEKP